MGKKRNEEEKKVIISFFKKIDKDMIFDFNLKVFRGRKDKIWSVLSNELKDDGVVISPLALFTAVNKNYYDLWDVLQISLAAIHTEEDDQQSQSSSSSSSSTHSGKEDMASEFYITFTQDEYINFQEQVKEYKRGDISRKMSGHKTVLRNYYTWEKYSWPQLLRKKIFQETTLHCAIIFKRAKLHPTGPIFATISGKCKECHAVFQGHIIQNPEQEHNVTFNFKISGKYDIKHSTDVKVPLKGEERQMLVRQMVNENKTASTIRNELASATMNDGDSEPAFIPKLATLRTAKAAFLKNSQVDMDAIVALYKAKSFQEYGNSIHNIGYSPFYVYFWSKSQIMIYRKFCENSNCKRISIDSTGGVAKKIIYPDKLKSKTIFLYEIVINYHGQYSVGSMLSDNHSALTIQNWLNVWFRAAGTSPSEVVVDMSLALMYACVPVFTHHKTLAEYLDQCYKILFDGSKELSEILLRNDVAHTVKLISSWDCLKKSHKLTKKMYMRGIGQLIQVTNINDLERLLHALFIVAYSDTEGVNEAGVETTCEKQKQWLIKRIATGTSDSLVDDQLSDMVQFDSTSYNNINQFSALKNPFTAWVERIATTAESIVNKSDEIGNRGNQQVLPEFVMHLLKISATLPMWTSIMCQYYPSSKRIASSASSESNFNQVKNRLFSDKQLPLRADGFVMEYIKRTDGYFKLVTAKAEKQLQPQYDDSVDVKAIKRKITEKTGVLEKIVGDVCQKNTKIHEVEKLDDFSAIAGLTLPDNTCSSCQLQLDVKKKIICCMCSQDLHDNDNCTVRYENELLCKVCFKKGISDRRFIEEQAEEQWMGKNVPPKKRLRRSYLEPDNEVLMLDFSKTRRSVAIGLLRNGHLVHTKPLKVDNNFVMLQNTCSFDAVTQLLCVAYCDSNAFKLRFDNIKNNDLCDLVQRILKSGVTAAAYKIRAKILFNTFKHVRLPDNILCVHAESAVFNTITKTFGDICMGTKTMSCESCNYNSMERIHFVSVEVVNINNLTKNIDDFLVSESKFRRCPNCSCARLLRDLRIDNNFVIIEPVNAPSLSLELEVSLDSIPKQIKVYEQTFILRGICAYQGTPDPNHLGHFVAYAYRHNDKWVMYNDLLKKSEAISPYKIVKCALLFYSI